MDAERLKKDKQEDGVNISELRMLVTYIHQLQDLLVSSDRELVHLQNNVTKTQSHLQMKAQEEKTWDNLKQQELTMYVERNKVIEQNFFDDLASTRFYRTSQASLAERG
jgi:flagellar FliJ protein